MDRSVWFDEDIMAIEQLDTGSFQIIELPAGMVGIRRKPETFQDSDVAACVIWEEFAEHLAVPLTDLWEEQTRRALYKQERGEKE